MHREKYFTRENYKEKLAYWQAILKDFYSSKRPFKFVPQETALLIIDMQEYFLNSNSNAYIPSAETILEPISNLIWIFRNYKQPIIYTKYGLSANDQEDNLMVRWWGNVLSLTDPLAEIHPSFPTDGCPIIIKESYCSFQKTTLELNLKSFDVKQLVIAGVHTHLCCEATARTAFCKGYTVWFPMDCLATYTEELHLGSLRAAAHGFAIPSTSQEIIELISSG